MHKYHDLLIEAATLLDREAKTTDREKCKRARNALWANRRDELKATATKLRAVAFETPEPTDLRDDQIDNAATGSVPGYMRDTVDGRATLRAFARRVLRLAAATGS